MSDHPLTRLNKATLKVGDIVGIECPSERYIGHRHFRYPSLQPHKIARITPARTKFIMEDGATFSEKEQFYEYDDNAIYQTAINTSAHNIADTIFKLTRQCTNAKICNCSDEVIVTVEEILSQAYQILKSIR